MILALLRDQTARLHERIERAVNIPIRLRTRDDYAALLARFYGFYTPLESRLAGVRGYETVGLNLEPRWKAGRLRDDLLALGHAADAVPRCDTVPDVPDMPAALGCLYVLEGATLGGQYVRKEVKRVHGFEPGTGCSFFSSYQDRVGEMWTEFCKALGDYAGKNPASHGAIVAAAAETFTRMEAWLA